MTAGWNKSPEETERDERVSATGAKVREHRSAHEEAEAKISDNKSKSLSYRQHIANNNVEMDVLGDFDSLNGTMKKRYIDLQESNKNYEKFITGLEAEMPQLNHATSMAEARMNNAKRDYQDAQNYGQDSDGITSNEREELSRMKMVGMNMKTKMYWVNRLGGGEQGMKKLQEIVPMI